MNGNKNASEPDSADNATHATGASDDSPTEAMESGEPSIQGRSRGRIIKGRDEKSGKSGAEQNRSGHNDNTSGGSGKIGQATESGRQRALPDE